VLQAEVDAGTNCVMAVRIEIAYEGELQCSAVHGPSGDRLVTDAPVDNHGKGSHFSPTDLLATATGACLLTVMGIAARPRGLELSGARVSVDKHMSTGLRRYVQRLAIRVRMPRVLQPDDRDLLERTARACPVLASLGPDTSAELRRGVMFIRPRIGLGPDL
jgi:putative redox protein